MLNDEVFISYLWVQTAFPLQHAGLLHNYIDWVNIWSFLFVFFSVRLSFYTKPVICELNIFTEWANGDRGRLTDQEGETGSPFKLKPKTPVEVCLSWYKIGTLKTRWVEFGICVASRSAASCLFHLFLRFWNQIFTWVSVRCRDAARLALSELLRYRFRSNMDSSWNTWLRLNTVRVFFFRPEHNPDAESRSRRASNPRDASSFSSVRLPSAVFWSISSLLSVIGSETAGEFLSLVDSVQLGSPDVGPWNETEQHSSWGQKIRAAYIPNIQLSYEFCCFFLM